MPERPPDVMRLARAEAMARRQEFVGTEHLLLALVATPDSPARRALAAHGISPAALRTEIHRLSMPGLGMVPENELPCTSRAKQAVEQAVDEARALNHNHVGPTHLMLALLDGGSTIATDARRTLGVTPDALRADVLREAGWA